MSLTRPRIARRRRHRPPMVAPAPKLLAVWPSVLTGGVSYDSVAQVVSNLTRIRRSVRPPCSAQYGCLSALRGPSRPCCNTHSPASSVRWPGLRCRWLPTLTLLLVPSPPREGRLSAASSYFSFAGGRTRTWWGSIPFVIPQATACARVSTSILRYALRM